jgi:hypothetical protein
MKKSPYELIEEDEFLPDTVLDQLEANLGEKCLSCALADLEPLDDREARA